MIGPYTILYNDIPNYYRPNHVDWLHVSICSLQCLLAEYTFRIHFHVKSTKTLAPTLSCEYYSLRCLLCHHRLTTPFLARDVFLCVQVARLVSGNKSCRLKDSSLIHPFSNGTRWELVEALRVHLTEVCRLHRSSRTTHLSRSLRLIRRVFGC